MTPLVRAAGAAPARPASTVIAGRSALVVVAPHPDDETLGAAHLMSAAHRARLPVIVLCLTDGAASHPRSRLVPPARMAARRRAELNRAVACLAPGARVLRLGAPDGALRSGGAAGSFAVRWLRAAIPPGALVVATWGGDPHADHRAAARIASAALDGRDDAALRFYPIWGRFSHGPAPAPARLVRVTAPPKDRRAKAAALACHASQMTPLVPDDPSGFVMAAAHQRHFLHHPEILIEPEQDSASHGPSLCAASRSLAPSDESL